MKRIYFGLVMVLFLLAPVFYNVFAADGSSDSEEAPSYYWRKKKYKKKYEELFCLLEREGFTRNQLRKLFSGKQIKFYDNLVRPAPKPEKEESQEEKKERIRKAREEYLDDLLSEASVKRGQKFLVTNDSLLSVVEGSLQVDKEIIASVLRIETNFGNFLGNYKVFNVFNTIFAESPSIKKQRRAEKELVALLILCRENGLDPLMLKGSWAGAFGLCQFIPSGFEPCALDGDGDGKIDLFSLADAVWSTANYLKKWGDWRLGRWDKRNERAVYAYNHSRFYVKTVELYAREIGFLSKK